MNGKHLIRFQGENAVFQLNFLSVVWTTANKGTSVLVIESINDSRRNNPAVFFIIVGIIESRAYVNWAYDIIELIGQTEEQRFVKGMFAIFWLHVLHYLYLQQNAQEMLITFFLILTYNYWIICFSRLNSIAMRSVFCLRQLRHFLLLNCASL